MSKAKYSTELKLEIVKEYEAGNGSYKSVAEKYSAQFETETIRKPGAVAAQRLPVF